VIFLGFIAQTIRIAMPYLFASAGGVVSERAGLIALTLEGYMLMAAFCAAIGSYFGGGPWAGIAAGIGGGVATALLYGVCCIRYRANQVVVGIAINLLAIGLTRFLLRLTFDSSSNSPRIGGFEATGTGLLALAQNPLIWLGALALPAVGWVIYRTPFGLRLRAVGEHPEAACQWVCRCSASGG
jgi:general nucleoside transport system permease protein